MYRIIVLNMIREYYTNKSRNESDHKIYPKFDLIFCINYLLNLLNENNFNEFNTIFKYKSFHKLCKIVINGKEISCPVPDINLQLEKQ